MAKSRTELFILLAERVWKLPETLAKPPSETRRLAAEGEQYVYKLLVDQGWHILSRNFQGRGFELDFVAAKGESLVVVEVKSRSRAPRNLEEAKSILGFQKRLSMRRGIRIFLKRRKELLLRHPKVRVDLALAVGGLERFELKWYPNVFPLD